MQPNIIIKIAGVSIIKDDATSSACAYFLEYVDERNRLERIFATHIGNGSVIRAFLQAAHLAIAAITRPLRRTAIIRIYAPESIFMAVDKDYPGYEEKPSHDIEVIEELRKWISFCGDLKFIKQDSPMSGLLSRAKICAETELPYDTGTVEK